MAKGEGVVKVWRPRPAETNLFPTRKNPPDSKGNQMAGKPGRSGGARPGAGRKPKGVAYIAPEIAKVVAGQPLDPRPTIELIALGHMEVSPQQFKALMGLMPYTNAKKGESKADEAAAKQKAAAAGKFAVRQGPRLVSSK